MGLSKEQFRALQEHWYEILEDSGFKDIEKITNGELVLRRSSSTIYSTYKSDNFNKAMKEEYFRIMSQISQDIETKFKNEVHKYILFRYCEGSRIKEIVIELKARGTPRTRDSVRYIIRRYENRWGVKSYGPKELHVK